ncbi:VOC family protein [Kitasatospora sp. DSM 101779]|uniref:VOC family protein n=1 Tax=Kitasatospora sp. DSM 101779 TaxID=2853165 RepID=UPI0021D8B790|nr:VOC family protein [Kitasatospora sp. DSM 101779]MCU7827017.1 VOC family protein [Kitasatospora sp. DSM 101779]
MEIPEHHKQAVIPHIMVDGAAEAIEFYAQAFGAVELFRLEGEAGRIVHAEVGIHGSTFMLGDVDAPFSTPDRVGTSVALHVYVPDVDGLTVAAAAGGAELLTAPTDMPYGARQSMLRDPFGHLWIFLTPIAAA